MSWSPQMLGRLADLRGRGLSFGTCARLLRVTRGAAIGAYHRHLAQP